MKNSELKPTTTPFGIVARTFTDNLFRNSYRWAGRLCRLLTPRAVHSLCAWRDYKRRGAQGASLRSEIYEKEPRSTKLWPFVISRFHCTFKHNLKVYVHGKIGRKTTTSSREPRLNDQIFVSGLHNCREFSQRLECLYQAMQTQEKSFLFLLENTFPEKKRKTLCIALIKREIISSRKVVLSTKSCTSNRFLFCKKMLSKIRTFLA